MGEKWMQIFKPEIDDHDKQQLFIYVQDGAMSIEYAAGRANQSVADFSTEMEKKGYKVPAKMLVKINERVGVKLLAKIGEEGIVSLGKLIPGIGALVNGAWDYTEARHIASRAYHMFIEHALPVA